MREDLLHLLQYQNNTVINYFCHHHSEFVLQEGQTLFTDLLSWLWLNAERKKQNKKTHLFGPLLILDEMWHCFILHTRDYVDFSDRYFGSYFHHEVEPIGHEHILEEEELTDFLQDCFIYLGQEWVTRRFQKAFIE